MTEGCRGEGGILVNKNGYWLSARLRAWPETPLGEPKNKYMELGPRDKVSQAFWHEWRKGNTISTPRGDVVYLDLRHLGEKKLHERLPFICELAKASVGVDGLTIQRYIPTAHYTMGGIETDQNCETRIKGLFAVGECSYIYTVQTVAAADSLAENWWSSAVWPVNKRQSVQQLPVMATKRRLKNRRQLALNNV
ncbi:FAD-binding protein [Escherichia coli]